MSGTLLEIKAPVVQTSDSAIHRISLREINCVIHWIEIYPVDSAIHFSNNWAQVFTMTEGVDKGHSG